MKNKFFYNILTFIGFCFIFINPTVVLANESQESATTSVGIEFYKNIKFNGHTEHYDKNSMLSIENNQTSKKIGLFPKTNSMSNQFTSTLGLLILLIICVTLIVKRNRRNYE
ncbi:LPXTG cell wall anchor domain-containing protein [Enterococcus faecalis]|uniref:LPXTG cell wall anchor domain-containing protein n=1 Tax=Enterococcus faecalis TaxID=1351 RepID=UPI001781DFF5|nr:LPXTG cell wall anchor domain-containing protein [Enterococcus faecalis]MBD9891334.1 LPXTG cell wall anchor domain-containing protein [Enterococcus faecalis]